MELHNSPSKNKYGRGTKTNMYNKELNRLPMYVPKAAMGYTVKRDNISPEDRSKWNDFQSYLKQKGHAGQSYMDRANTFPHGVIEEYNKANPSKAITGDMIYRVQDDFINEPTHYGRDKISKKDNWLGSITSTYRYPNQTNSVTSEVPARPMKSKRYETLYDVNGKKYFSPVYEGNWSRSERDQDMRESPKEYGGIPVMAGDSWHDMYKGTKKTGSTSNDWKPLSDDTWKPGRGAIGPDGTPLTNNNSPEQSRFYNTRPATPAAQPEVSQVDATQKPWEKNKGGGYRINPKRYWSGGDVENELGGVGVRATRVYRPMEPAGYNQMDASMQPQQLAQLPVYTPEEPFSAMSQMEPAGYNPMDYNAKVNLSGEQKPLPEEDKRGSVNWAGVGAAAKSIGQGISGFKDGLIASMPLLGNMLERKGSQKTYRQKANNPYAMGTGATALYKNGGNIPSLKVGEEIELSPAMLQYYKSLGYDFE